MVYTSKSPQKKTPSKCEKVEKLSLFYPIFSQFCSGKQTKCARKCARDEKISWGTNLDVSYHIFIINITLNLPPAKLPPKMTKSCYFRPFLAYYGLWEKVPNFIFNFWTPVSRWLICIKKSYLWWVKTIDRCLKNWTKLFYPLAHRAHSSNWVIFPPFLNFQLSSQKPQ